MSSWIIDTERTPGVLLCEVVGSPSVAEMTQLVVAHNAAVDSFAGRGYTVFCDLREMSVLSPESATTFEQAKAYSCAQPNFLGSSVLVASTVVGMQHRRTSSSAGVIDTEQIGSDEASLWAHLTALLEPSPV